MNTTIPNRVVDRPRDHGGSGDADTHGKGDKHGRGGTHGHHPRHDRHPGHVHHGYRKHHLHDWNRLWYDYLGGSRRYGCDPYDYRYGYATVSVLPYPPDAYGPPPCAATGMDAWAMLTEGRTASAYKVFDCLAQVTPDDGLVLIGLALSAAMLDEDLLAVSALRDAMRLDPASLLDVPGSVLLDERLAVLADRYDARARHNYGDLDALFMVSAMRYLAGDDDAARYAGAVGITLGDDDAGARNLKDLIEAFPSDAALRPAR